MRGLSDVTVRARTTRARGREHRIIRSLYLVEGVLEEHNKKLQAKYAKVKEEEQRSELDGADDAELVLLACGMCARASRDATRELNNQGHKVALFRPITLWPFPEKALGEIS